MAAFRCSYPRHDVSRSMIILTVLASWCESLICSFNVIFVLFLIDLVVCCFPILGIDMVNFS
jgi:hypothetical protein